jgi:hypothetical protein
MFNKFFLTNKPITYLKSYKFIIFILLLILLIIIFFVNNDSTFKIIEGNTTCKFSGNTRLEKDIEKMAERYKKRIPNQSNIENRLNRVEGININISSIK